VTRLDDPDVVASEYADETRLMRRARGFAGIGTAHDARIPLVEEVVAARPHRVLEVGCGWGELAEWVARETGAEVVAIDLSPRMVELARERGVEALQADVQALPFADAEFDLVIAAWMLYHVPDLDRGLAEIARVLRPGGRIVAATNAVDHLHELWSLVGRDRRAEGTFNDENGEAFLRPHFSRVVRHDVRFETTFPDEAAVRDYIGSSARWRHVELPPFETPLRATAASAVFVATRAI
jgi:SAM-dependent methyltransferase